MQNLHGMKLLCVKARFKDRVMMLPESIVATLRAHLVRIKDLHEEDLAVRLGKVY